jgi:hypothetical protein
VQTSVQDQACDDAGQEGVLLCLWLGSGEEDGERHLLLFRCLGVGRDRGLF